MNNVTGQAVTGKDFFDRPTLLSWIWERVPVSNLLLTAPRRSGKTSIMFHLRDKTHHSYRGVFVNVEGASGAGQMIHLIIKALQEDEIFTSLGTMMSDTFKKLFSREIKAETPFGSLELGLAIENNWEQAGEVLLKRLQGIGKVDKEKPAKKLLLLIDEFPILLERLRKQGDTGKEEAIQLLHWFRGVRIDPGFQQGHVRFVFSGSIGLEGVVSRLGASKAINDLENVPVEPLSTAEALKLLHALDPEKKVLKGEPAAQKLLSFLEEPYPYYLQLFFNQLLRKSRLEGTPCDEAVIERLYQQEMLGLSGQTALRHMDERLNDALAEDEAARVRTLLDKVARTSKGVTAREAERILSGLDAASERYGSQTAAENPTQVTTHHALRQLLLHDGYLRELEGRLLFRTRLLKDFWIRHRGLRR